MMIPHMLKATAISFAFFVLGAPRIAAADSVTEVNIVFPCTDGAYPPNPLARIRATLFLPDPGGSFDLQVFKNGDGSEALSLVSFLGSACSLTIASPPQAHFISCFDQGTAAPMDATYSIRATDVGSGVLAVTVQINLNEDVWNPIGGACSSNVVCGSRKTTSVSLRLVQTDPVHKGQLISLPFDIGCVVGLDYMITYPAPTPDNPDPPPQALCTSEGTPFIEIPPFTSCDRLPVHAALALDKSGSMALEGRWGQLEDAVSVFHEAWSSLRQAEHAANAGEGVQCIKDQWTALFFDSKTMVAREPTMLHENNGAVYPWLANLPGCASPLNLSQYSVWEDITTNDEMLSLPGSQPDPIQPGGSTSIGSALDSAATNLVCNNDPSCSPEDSTSIKKDVIILASDGIQTAPPFVSVCHCHPNPMGQGVVCSLASPEAACDPNSNCVAAGVSTHDDFDDDPCVHQLGLGPAPGIPDLAYNGAILTVSAGTPVSINETLLVQIAAVTGGQYYSTGNLLPETDLRTFFLNALELLAQTNTFQSIKHSRKVPFNVVNRGAHLKLRERRTSSTKGARFSVTSSTRSLFLTAMHKGSAPWSVAVFQPNGSLHEVHQYQGAKKSASFSIANPAPGDWRAVLYSESHDSEFFLSVIADDLLIKSEFSVGRRAYAPGDAIPLEASLVREGIPVPGAKVTVKVDAPHEAFGESLAKIQDPEPLLGGDAPSLAQQLAASDAARNAFAHRDQSTVTLNDTDGDGTYTGSFTASKEGLHRFMFHVSAADSVVGQIERETERDTFVRAVPHLDGLVDRPTTILNWSNASNPRPGVKSMLYLEFVPATKLGDRLGPGWENYFPIYIGGVVGAETSEIVFPRYLGDGRYAANFRATPQSDIRVGFIDKAVFLGTNEHARSIADRYREDIGKGAAALTAPCASPPESTGIRCCTSSSSKEGGGGEATCLLMLMFGLRGWRTGRKRAS